MREWYRFVTDVAEKAPTVADIHIVDVIGGWEDQTLNELLGTDISVTAKGFLRELAALPASVKDIRVHINSPGGHVWAGVNIANALRAEKSKGRKVETIVEGIAASIASVIAMAGDRVTMADTALMFVHDPFAGIVGNASELREAADYLDKMRDSSIIPAYQWHTDKTAEEVAEIMGAATWMSADEAIEMGFADEKVEGLKAAASIDPRFMARMEIPEQYKDRVAELLEPEDETEPAAALVVPEGAVSPEVVAAIPPGDIVAAEDAIAPADLIELCGTSDLDLAFARVLIAENLTPDQARQRIQAEQAKRKAENERQEQITALCSKVGHEDLADDFIAGGMPLDAARDLMTKLTAKLDKVEIDAGLKPDHGQAGAPVIDHQAIYERRRALTAAAPR